MIFAQSRCIRQRTSWQKDKTIPLKVILLGYGVSDTSSSIHVSQEHYQEASCENVNTRYSLDASLAKNARIVSILLCDNGRDESVHGMYMQFTLHTNLL